MYNSLQLGQITLRTITRPRWSRFLCTVSSGDKSLKAPRSSGTWPDDLSESLTGANTNVSLEQEIEGLQKNISKLQKKALLDEYLRGILDAQCLVYDVCEETDLQYAHGLSKLLENDVYFKREDQQPVFSFKIRGAYNKIAGLPKERIEKGIVTCSAGNHAQGVALSASKLDIDNIIIMPKATPAIKVNAVRKFGGNVVLHGNNFDEAQAEAMRLAKDEGRTLIHPFDDPAVICGQGTIGIEILKQMPSTADIHAVFCCVGGGGLLAGVATYIKMVNPKIKMIGVEASDAASMTKSVEEGNIITLPEVGLFADGAAVKKPGENTFALINELNDDMITVSTEEICSAIKQGFNDTRCVLEPAGALAIAGLVKYVAETGVKGKTLVAVASGANMDFDRLRFVSERADSSETLLSVQIPEEPGSFWKLYEAIYPRNVTEFSYRYAMDKDARIILSFQAKSSEDRESLISDLREKDFHVSDLCDNELAKTHIRHLAAGRALIDKERIFRFEFPERPGSLREFLKKLTGQERQSNGNFNVTLFHYRNHGADIGRVLVGIQVPTGQTEHFEKFLQDLNFVYKEETQNEAFSEFLR